MSHVMSSGICHQVRLEPVCSATEGSYSLEILDIATIGIIGVNNRDANQAAQMRRLIGVFVVCIRHKTGFLMAWFICKPNMNSELLTACM